MVKGADVLMRCDDEVSDCGGWHEGQWLCSVWLLHVGP
jgi:hypothetical protein